MNRGNKVVIIAVAFIILLIGVIFVSAKFAVFPGDKKDDDTIEPTPNPNPNPNPNPEPEPQPEKNKSTYFGATFIAHKGEVFVIKNGSTNVTFEVTGFYYHPCPTGAQCIWSGLDVFYQITECPSNPMMGMPCSLYEKDEPLERATMPYSVEIKDSDYKTYAKVIVKRDTGGYPTTGE